MQDSSRLKDTGSRLFAKQQKILPSYLAFCKGSLPAFVSQHAAKKPVRNSSRGDVTKAVRWNCLIPVFHGK
jgi:hypothetical protein